MIRTVPFVFLVLSALLPQWSRGQCPNNNVLTGTAITPPCPGTQTVPCVLGGQYVLVNVVAGNTYTFSTCGATWDTQITVYNNAGGGALANNDDACGPLGWQSSVTWVATFTGTVRVLLDQWNSIIVPCANNSTCAPLVITCAPPPLGDCIYTLTLYDSFLDGWGSSFVSVSINGGPATNYTVTPGVPSVTFQIGIFIGNVISIGYNASGPFQTDNSYVLSLGGAWVFNSGSPPLPGTLPGSPVFSAVLDCIPPPPQQEDCLGAVTICSNVSFSNNTTNEGAISDINVVNSGCLDDVEYQGTWYIFSPSSSGNLGMTIDPIGPDDYDWAVWGPFPSGTTLAGICPPLGAPIRCAASSAGGTFVSTGSYNTGMGHPTFSPPQFAPVSVSYGIGATPINSCPLIPPQRCGWVPGMQVTAGQVFLMYISNWTQSSMGFSLTWTLQNGASLDCTVLPVELSHFDVHRAGEDVRLEWSTASELDCDRFEIERSIDGQQFEWIGTVPGAGNSSTMLHYTSLDQHPQAGINYYRLRQVDHNGDHQLSTIRSILFQHHVEEVLLIPNPGSGVVDVLLEDPIPGAQFVMMDATGREVMRATLVDDRTTLSTSSLPSGLYGFRVVLPSGAVSASGSWVRE